MKHTAKRIVLVCGALLTVFIFSCSDLFDLQLPESIVVKSSDVQYAMPAGNYFIKLSDQLNAAKLQKNMSKGDSKMAVYDYNPNGIGVRQQFIIDYPITEIGLDFDDYMGDLNDALNGTDGEESEFAKTINIPDIPEEQKKLTHKVDISSLSSRVMNEVKSIGVPSIPIPIVETPNKVFDTFTELGEDKLKVEIKNPVFTAMKFTRGKLKIDIATAVTDTAFGEGYSVDIRAGLYTTTKEAINDGEYTNDIRENGTLVIDLAGQTLYPSMYLRLEAKIHGSDPDPSKIHIYYVQNITITEAELEEATGLTLEAPIALDGFAIETPNEIGGDDPFVSNAVIKSGSLKISGAYPTGWKNVTSHIDVTVDGAISVTEGANDLHDVQTAGMLVHKEANLASKRIAFEEKLTVSARNISLSFSNATVTFTQPSIEVVCETAITTVGDAEVLLTKFTDKMGDLTHTVNTPVSDSMKNTIKRASIGEITISGTIETKPNLDLASLKVKTILSSEVFKIAEKESDAVDIMQPGSSFGITLCALGTDCDASPRHEQNWEGVDLDFAGDSAPTEFDFEVTLDFSENDEYVTIKSVQLGQDYAFTPKFTPSFDCKEVVLYANDKLNQSSGDKPIDTGLNIRELFTDFLKSDNTEQVENLIDSIEFKDIKGYLYIVAPEAADAAGDPFRSDVFSFTGEVVANKDTDAREVLIDKGTPLELMRNVPSFASLADENFVITRNLFDAGIYSAITKDDAICDLINTKPTSLLFDYDIQFTGQAENDEIVLTRAQLQSFKNTSPASESTAQTETQKIKMSIAIVLPFHLNITQDVQIDDFMAFVGEPLTDDLLNRDEANDDFDKYVSLIKYIKCSYTFKNSLGIPITALFQADGISDKEMLFDSATHDFYLTNTEISSIFKTYPFIPTINATIKKGDVSIPRNAEFGLSLVLCAETDGECEVWSK